MSERDGWNHLYLIDGATGAVKWVFNTVPQGPGDDGWEVARDTWKNGARAGGGVCSAYNWR